MWGQDDAGECLAMHSRSRAFPIREAVPVGYWAHLGAAFNGIKMYWVSITLIKTYTALFAAIGGWDGMDAGGAHWMTCFINRSPPLSCLGFG